jgi:flagellar hook-length control protein FliK
MQSLNSSTAKSSAVLPMLAGTAAPKAGGNAAETGASFSQMLRDSSPPVSAPAPAPAPAPVRDKGEQRSKSEADSGADKPASSEDGEPQAADGRPASSQATAQAQASKQRRMNQERDQALRQAEAQQQAGGRALGAREAVMADDAKLGAAGETFAARDKDESGESLLAGADTLLSGLLPTTAVNPALAAKAEGAGDAANASLAAAAASLLAGKAHDDAAAAQSKSIETDAQPSARPAALDIQSKNQAAPAQALELSTQDLQQQQPLQASSSDTASFASELHKAEQTSPAATTPSLPAFSHAAAAAATAHQTEAKTAAAETGARLDLAARMESPQFASEMSARLSVLAADGVQRAELHLNPAEMGPVSVQIVLDGQQAQISFHAEHGETRAVLESSLPELAGALREQGLTLSGGGVFQQSAEQRQAQTSDPGSRSGRNADKTDDDADSAATVSSMAPPARQLRGVVDVYA